MLVMSALLRAGIAVWDGSESKRWDDHNIDLPCSPLSLLLQPKVARVAHSRMEAVHIHIACRDVKHVIQVSAIMVAMLLQSVL